MYMLLMSLEEKEKLKSIMKDLNRRASINERLMYIRSLAKLTMIEMQLEALLIK